MNQQTEPDPIDAISGWPVPATAGVVSRYGGTLVSAGPDSRRYPWASVTKVLASLAIWVGVEEGTVDWDDAVGPPDVTLAHLLAHASGLAPDDDRQLARPGTRRIYSNHGIELATEYLAARAGIPFERYLAEAVLEPLRLSDTTLDGSPASGATGSLRDLLALGRELLAPTLVSAETVATTTAVAFPGLAGVLPGFGRQDPNDWGLGVEIRDHKHPHWTGTLNSPDTFGHFGQSGSFLWVDPVQEIAVGSLAGEPFGPWAAEVWPVLSDGVIRVYGRPEAGPPVTRPG